MWLRNSGTPSCNQTSRPEPCPSPSNCTLGNEYSEPFPSLDFTTAEIGEEPPLSTAPLLARFRALLDLLLRVSQGFELRQIGRVLYPCDLKDLLPAVADAPQVFRMVASDFEDMPRDQPGEVPAAREFPTRFSKASSRPSVNGSLGVSTPNVASAARATPAAFAMSGFGSSAV